MKLALLVTAAGSSSRFGGSRKKEYLPLEAGDTSGTVLSASLEAFLKTADFSPVVVTIPRGHEKLAEEALCASAFVKDFLQGARSSARFGFASGGGTRQESVFCGLKAIAALAAQNPPDAVLIHDGARPWVTAEVINAVIEKLALCGASVTATPATDTQKEVDESGKITAHLRRDRIFAVQTPQAFLFEPLLKAHEKAAGDGCTYTDDTEIWGCYCGDVYVARGSIANRKITYKQDL